VGLLFAVRRNRASRGVEPSGETGGRRDQLRVGAALTAFAAILFIVGVVFTDKARETPATGSAGLAAAEGEPLRTDATGQQWLWRYDYPNGAFSYYKLVVPVDTAVELKLRSTDVVHTWNVPDLSGKRDAVPGKTNRVIFRADEEGTFDGRSATLSGQGYASMEDRKSTRLNSSHVKTSYGVFCLKKKITGRRGYKPLEGKQQRLENGVAKHMPDDDTQDDIDLAIRGRRYPADESSIGSVLHSRSL